MLWSCYPSLIFETGMFLAQASFELVILCFTIFGITVTLYLAWLESVLFAQSIYEQETVASKALL